MGEPDIGAVMSAPGGIWMRSNGPERGAECEPNPSFSRWALEFNVLREHRQSRFNGRGHTATRAWSGLLAWAWLVTPAYTPAGASSAMMPVVDALQVPMVS
jgi:hypothetical protein